MRKYNIKNPYQNNHIIRQTIELAKKSKKLGEIPVAAIIIDKNTKKIIAKATNNVENKKNAILHAEIICINKATKKLKSKYCHNTEIYINLQPCQMCYTAICIAQISKIYFSSYNNINGFFYHTPNLYKPEIYGGIMEDISKKDLLDFFYKLR